jgi:bifunctional non-homologous end joining protein LigD
MTLEISNPEKKIFPHFTKKEFVEYYNRIARIMLPHIEQRLVSMYRFPDGVAQKGFFQKNKLEYFPDWITHEVVRKAHESVDYVICNDKRTLVYLASQVAEIHIGTSRTGNLKYPDKMIFDLDPTGRSIDSLRKVIRKLRRLLQDIGLQPYLMTTGKRGYHVVVPIKPEQENRSVREFALKIAIVLEQDDPMHLTTKLMKDKRGHRIFIDVNRNSPNQTSIAPYSIRAVPEASVALPLGWAELGRIKPGDYDIDTTLKRMVRKQDPWKTFHEESVSLREVIGRLQK